MTYLTGAKIFKGVLYPGWAVSFYLSSFFFSLRRFLGKEGPALHCLRHETQHYPGRSQGHETTNQERQFKEEHSQNTGQQWTCGKT